MTSPLRVGFLLFPGVVQLDVTAALQVLAFSPALDLQLVAAGLDPVISAEGLLLTPNATFSSCPPLTALVVPGGGLGQAAAMTDPEVLNFLAHQAAQARWLAGVCTGSLLLAAAGLLRGRRATTHWAFREQLAWLGAEVVDQRVVVDGDRLTCAGVTAGIDLALRLLALLGDEEVARLAGLMLEYAPEPPYGPGTPEAAGPARVNQLLGFGSSLIAAFSQAIGMTPSQ